MADFFSERFGKNVWITRHARQSMERRNVDLPTLFTVIEQGKHVSCDLHHGWIFLHLAERTDNFVCAAVVIESAVIIKTVMINWQQEAKL